MNRLLMEGLTGLAFVVATVASPSALASNEIPELTLDQWVEKAEKLKDVTIPGGDIRKLFEYGKAVGREQGYQDAHDDISRSVRDSFINWRYLIRAQVDVESEITALSEIKMVDNLFSVKTPVSIEDHISNSASLYRFSLPNLDFGKLMSQVWNEGSYDEDLVFYAVDRGNAHFISSEGHMVTNLHTVDRNFDLGKFVVKYKNGSGQFKYIDVDVLAYDPKHDLALLKAKVKNPDFPEITLLSEKAIKEGLIGVSLGRASINFGC